MPDTTTLLLAYSVLFCSAIIIGCLLFIRQQTIINQSSHYEWKSDFHESPIQHTPGNHDNHDRDRDWKTHTGLLLGVATFHRQFHTVSFELNWDISQLRQEDIQTFLIEFLNEETSKEYTFDRISMVTSHLYGFIVREVSSSHILVQIYVADEFTKQEERDLLDILRGKYR
jgi:hypothetical protein